MELVWPRAIFYDNEELNQLEDHGNAETDYRED
jgi:hypothetical protein